MARQRASQVRDAFARVGTAAPVSTTVDDDASISAGEKDGINTGVNEGAIAGKDASPIDVSNDSDGDGVKTGKKTAVNAGGRARKKASMKRRVGRPRGPDRMALSIRILASNDARLTAAVHSTGQSPQYIVDAALTAYFDALGI